MANDGVIVPLDDLAAKVGLDISDVQPLPQMPGDQYDAYKYRMSVKGTYQEIGDFLTNVGTLQRIVAPINVLLNPTPKPGATKLEPEPSKPGER